MLMLFVHSVKMCWRGNCFSNDYCLVCKYDDLWFNGMWDYLAVLVITETV